MKDPIVILDQLMTLIDHEENSLPLGASASAERLAEGWAILCCASHYLKGLHTEISESYTNKYSSVQGAIDRCWIE